MKEQIELIRKDLNSLYKYRQDDFNYIGCHNDIIRHLNVIEEMLFNKAGNYDKINIYDKDLQKEIEHIVVPKEEYIYLDKIHSIYLKLKEENEKNWNTFNFELQVKNLEKEILK